MSGVFRCQVSGFGDQENTRRWFLVIKLGERLSTLSFSRKCRSGARLPTAANGLLPQWPPPPAVGCLFLWFGPGTTSIVLCLRSPALPLRSELSSPRVSLNANEHSRENGNSSICHAWTPAFAGVTFLLDSTPQILAGPGESTAYDPGSF